MSCVREPVSHPFGMYSPAEERANFLTHGVGFLLSLCGAVYLLT
ncbi:MAG: hypothetical protein JWN70_4936, partial [Planctomycetaceae bacterium]|nr:hypothetical protein [Planctomycetaceae bacterium]